MARVFWRGLLVGVGCALSAFHVQAIPITYTLTSTATGTLGISPFTNAPITVTLRGDITGVTPGPIGPDNLNNVLVNTGPATVSIAGLGTATFTHSIDVLSTFNAFFDLGTVTNASGVVIAQVDPSGNTVTGILGATNPAFFGYDLRSPFGPFSTGGGVANEGPADGPFPTTGGNLFFAAGQAFNGRVTFTATTPEPATLALLGLAMAGLAASRRRKLN